MPPSQVHKRGRPPKYGQPAKVVAITLPIDIVNRLAAIDEDLGWAIVSLVEKSQRRAARSPVPEAQLVEIGGGQSLITVNPAVFRSLPGVRMVPVSETQAFLALESGRGMADLELAVQDRLASLTPVSRHRAPLERLLDQLRAWRHTRALSFESRSIILVGQHVPVRP